MTRPDRSCPHRLTLRRRTAAGLAVRCPRRRQPLRRGAAHGERARHRARPRQASRRMERTRSRLVIAAGGFCALFAAVLAKLAAGDDRHAAAAAPGGEAGGRDRRQCPAAAPIEATLPGQRATITDRNGQPLAISLPTVCAVRRSAADRSIRTTWRRS